MKSPKRLVSLVSGDKAKYLNGYTKIIVNLKYIVHFPSRMKITLYQEEQRLLSQEKHQLVQVYIGDPLAGSLEEQPDIQWTEKRKLLKILGVKLTLDSLLSSVCCNSTKRNGTSLY